MVATVTSWSPELTFRGLGVQAGMPSRNRWLATRVLARPSPVPVVRRCWARMRALPDDGHLGDPPRVLDGEDDLADDGADQLFALAQRGGRAWKTALTSVPARVINPARRGSGKRGGGSSGRPGRVRRAAAW